MRIPAPVPALVSLACAVLLSACAAPKPRFEGLRKCYLLDSTDHLSAADYDAMFRAARAPGDPETPGDSLLPCDSVGAPRLRIRPVKSTVPSMASTGWLLGANAAMTGAGAGLALGLQEGLYFLAPALTLPLAPVSRATYLIEYKDSAGGRHSERLQVREGAWFNKRAESRRELLDASSRKISNRLFGAAEADREKRDIRVSIEPLELIYYARHDAVILAPHVEKLLRGNFAMEFSPLVNIPLSGYDGSVSLQFGPRRYFFGRHWGPFLGLGPYGAAGYDENPYVAAGLPAVTGFAWQGWRFSVAVEAGAGPVYRWGGPESDFGWLALGGINVGLAF
jgi:hypothetical protein